MLGWRRREDTNDGKSTSLVSSPSKECNRWDRVQETRLPNTLKKKRLAALPRHLENPDPMDVGGERNESKMERKWKGHRYQRDMFHENVQWDLEREE